MNKRQTRLFAIGSTALAALIFIGLTIDSHRQFPKLTNAQNITPAVTRGKDVWHDNNCINCHTLFGEGAYYAPDLTKIAQHRGEPYLQAYLRDPSQFYDEARHRRLMPRQNLSENNIADLIAFLDWIGKVDNADWPPRPIMVSGGAMAAGHDVAGTSADTRPVDIRDNPIAQGEHVFKGAAQPPCTSCHSIVAGVTMAGPSLAGVAARAEAALASPDYKGAAKDVSGYLREAITRPSAHIAAGGNFSAGGTSFMPATYGTSLQPEQVDQVIAYLTSLK